jgi:hypothetical protein
MIQAGTTINRFPLFMAEYPQAGGVIIGTIVGGEISGITCQYLTSKYNRTGAPGKRADIGRDIKAGVSKVCNPECDHNNTGEQVKNTTRLNHSAHSNNTGEQVKNTTRLNHSAHSNNTGGEVKNPTRPNPSTNREARKEAKEGMVGERVTSRMMKGSTQMA